MMLDRRFGQRRLLVRVAYLACALVAWPWAKLTTRAPSRQVVFCYHGVRRAQAGAFRRQLHALEGKCAGVVLTFDDAFENLTENAIPALRAAELPATLFAVTGNLGAPPAWIMPPNHEDRNESTMTAERLRQVAASGWVRIGSHTVTHRHLADLDDEAVWWELTESKRQLERILAARVEDLALPHGSYDDRVLRLARKAGYRRVYTLDERVVDEGDEARGVYGRFLVSPDVWPIEIILTGAGAYAWLYPWRRFVRRMRRSLISNLVQGNS